MTITVATDKRCHDYVLTTKDRPNMEWSPWSVDGALLMSMFTSPKLLLTKSPKLPLCLRLETNHACT